MDADFLIPVLWEWLEFAVRWLHVITAISWIGTSFYFIALDLGLRKISANEDGIAHENGIAGEEWQVHGGGFYNIKKYQQFFFRNPDIFFRKIMKLNYLIIRYLYFRLMEVFFDK